MDDQEVDGGILEGLRKEDRRGIGQLIINLLKDHNIDECKVAVSQFFEEIREKEEYFHCLKYLLPLLKPEKLEEWLKETIKERYLNQKDIDKYFIDVLPWLTPEQISKLGKFYTKTGFYCSVSL